MPRTLRDARTIEGDVQAGADANFPASGLVSLAAIRSMASRASGLRSRGRCQPRRERPRRCRNANKSDEFAPLHPHLTGEQRTSAPKERSTLPANGANRARSTPSDLDRATLRFLDRIAQAGLHRGPRAAAARCRPASRSCCCGSSPYPGAATGAPRTTPSRNASARAQAPPGRRRSGLPSQPPGDDCSAPKILGSGRV
jgi:hypothetical protein